MKKRLRIYRYGLVCAVLALVAGRGYPQDIVNEKQKEKQALLEEIKSTFINTLNEMEVQKTRRAQELDAQLQARLQSALNAWVISAKQAKEKDLNRLLHNTWENAFMLISPMPYDYYLRNCEYTIKTADIVKKDSPLTSYGASAQILETLSIERYHAETVSSLEPYLHMVITPIQLQLMYEADAFIVKETTYGPSSISQGWQQ